MMQLEFSPYFNQTQIHDFFLKIYQLFIWETSRNNRQAWRTSGKKHLILLVQFDFSTIEWAVAMAHDATSVLIQNVKKIHFLPFSESLPENSELSVFFYKMMMIIIIIKNRSTGWIQNSTAYKMSI